MTSVNYYNLEEKLKTIKLDSLTDSFSKQLLNLKRPALAYLEDMELYSEIEADEWEIIFYFIQLGIQYNPLDETEFSPIQQRAFELIDILHDDFKLGLNIDELSPAGQYKKF